MGENKNWREAYGKCISYFTDNDKHCKYGIIDREFYEEITQNKYKQLDHIPCYLGDAIWYGVTACNPGNTQKTAEENESACEQLLQDLKLLRPKPLIIDPEYDTDITGDEIGYRLRYPVSIWNKEIELEIIKLLIGYGQAGMYKWYKDNNQNFIQQVIPCLKEWEIIRSSNPVHIFYAKQNISSKL